MNVGQLNRLANSLYTGNPADVRPVVREFTAAGLIPAVDVDQLDDAQVRQVALNAVNNHHERGTR